MKHSEYWNLGWSDDDEVFCFIFLIILSYNVWPFPLMHCCPILLITNWHVSVFKSRPNNSFIMEIQHSDGAWVSWRLISLVTFFCRLTAAKTSTPRSTGPLGGESIGDRSPSKRASYVDGDSVTWRYPEASMTVCGGTSEWSGRSTRRSSYNDGSLKIGVDH